MPRRALTTPTHAWQDAEDAAAGTWRFAGQTTVCVTVGCNNHTAGDRPTYLQLWASSAGADWTQGFDALGELFPFEPDGEPDEGIMNVPDFWKREETGFPLDLLYFGSNAYWLGVYNRSGSGPGQTAFVPTTPQQQFGSGPGEGHGYYSAIAGAFVWYGWLPGSPPDEPASQAGIQSFPSHAPSHTTRACRPRATSTARYRLILCPRSRRCGASCFSTRETRGARTAASAASPTGIALTLS